MRGEMAAALNHWGARRRVDKNVNRRKSEHKRIPPGEWVIFHKPRRSNAACMSAPTGRMKPT